MEKDDLLLLILQIVRVNGNVDYVLNKGITHIELFNLLNELEDENIITYKGGFLNLTEKGRNIFVRLNKEKKNKGIYMYLSPKFDIMIEKWDLDRIYLPLKTVRNRELFSLMHESAKIDESSINNEPPF